MLRLVALLFVGMFILAGCDDPEVAEEPTPTEAPVVEEVEEPAEEEPAEEEAVEEEAEVDEESTEGEEEEAEEEE